MNKICIQTDRSEALNNWSDKVFWGSSWHVVYKRTHFVIIKDLKNNNSSCNSIIFLACWNLQPYVEGNRVDVVALVQRSSACLVETTCTSRFTTRGGRLFYIPRSLDQNPGGLGELLVLEQLILCKLACAFGSQ